LASFAGYRGIVTPSETIDMEYRGPILLVFGMSLVLSPIAINLATTGKMVRGDSTTVGQVDIDTGCDGQTLTFVDDTLCTEQTATHQRDRSMPGGAMFVSARD
jgi:hypothetical protein